MGRKKQSLKTLGKKAEARGYSYGVYHEEDSKRVSTTYVPKTIKDQGYVLDRYEVYVCSARSYQNARLTTLRRWVAFVRNQNRDEGVTSLDDTISADVLYIIGA